LAALPGRSSGTLGFVLGNNLPLLGRVAHTIGIIGTIIAVVFVLALIVIWRRRRRLVPERAASSASADPEP
jgi:membrane protein DedA with SNARE-associated domain